MKNYFTGLLFASLLALSFPAHAVVTTRIAPDTSLEAILQYGLYDSNGTNFHQWGQTQNGSTNLYLDDSRIVSSTTGNTLESNFLAFTPENFMPGLSFTSATQMKSELDGYLALKADLADLSPIAFSSSAGTSSQFWKGDGTLGTIQTIPTTLDSFAGGSNSLRFTSAINDRLEMTSGVNTGDQDLSAYEFTANVNVKLAGKADVNHEHSSNDITDSTPLGRALLTTPSGAAVRSAIGAASAVLAGRMYSDTTQQLSSFPTFKTGTTTSGSVTFHLTTDGTSSGTALYPNTVDPASITFYVNDSANIYTYSYVISNFNKTITITVNCLDLMTPAISAAANGTTVYMSAWGN